MSRNHDLELNSLEPLHTARSFSSQPVDSFSSNSTLPNTAPPKSDVSISRSEPIVEQGSRSQDPERIELLEDNETISPRKNFWLSIFAKKPRKRNHPGPVRDYSEVPNANEPSKVVRSSSRLLALRHFCWVHLPAVLITFTLLSLYIAKIQWNGPSTEALNSLQFAAKVHEGLIMMSLGDILQHWISHKLYHRDTGIPLGFLSSAFYLGAPFRYITSSELWAPMIQSSDRRQSNKMTGAMVILVTVLCLGASPFSAIAMIPRQGWLRAHDEDFTIKRQADSAVYTTSLNYKSGPYLNSSMGSNMTLEGLSPQAASDIPLNPLGPFQNITYANYQARGRPISIMLRDGMAITTCPISTISNLLAAQGWRLGLQGLSAQQLVRVEQEDPGSTKRKGWKQPLLAATCAKRELVGGVVDFQFWAPFVNQTLSLNPEQYPILSYFAKKASSTPGPVGHASLNLRDTMELPVSTDMLFASVVNDTLLVNNTVTRKIFLQFNLCLIYARWVEADLWVEPVKSPDVLSHLPFSNKRLLSSIKDSFGTTEFIHMDEDWLEGIASLPNRSFYEAISHYYAISAGALDMESVKMGEPIDPRKSILYFTEYVYFYSYVFQSSPGIPFAFCLLFLHVFMVLVHLIISLLSKHPWQGSSWESFGDMLVLALRSKAPDELDSDYEQVASSKTWTKTVIIKKMSEDGRPEIFLKDNKEFKQPPQEEARM
ncbi:hypothetical protein FSARC_5982 [Fusarium sarcochroum]|uniref:Uncharacterized protein n=1 Tax=Fusarium sarcochroum TaxID=1208366 RepID=A0A8H4TYK8_9HYPO|nr:hypothetical protein FSARC_5982 [Fusarium sarcochroum]